MKLFGSNTNIAGLKSGKWRQYGLVAAIGLGLYGLLYLMFAAESNEPKKMSQIDKSKITTTHVATPGSQLDPRDSWIGGAGAKVADHDGRIIQQEQATKDLSTKFAALEKELREKSTAPAVQPPRPVEPTESTEPQPKAASTSPVAAVFPPGTPGTAIPTALPRGVTLPPGVSGADAHPAPAPVLGIGHITLERDVEVKPATGGVTGAVSGAANGLRNNKSPRSTSTFLPIGFVKATLLGGLDAPTGGQSQQNPLPVILRLDDLAVLPNHFRANVKNCMLIGAGYGNLSAERAYVRLETLSCVRNDRQVIEIPAHGTVYGEDGKLGMRGRVVSKQGQIIANALLAGVISGIGQGIQYQNSTTAVTPVGNVVQTANNGFSSGVAGGVGQALNRLANYYITLAEKVFPVIEIDSARRVDVAFTKGSELSVPLPGTDDMTPAEENDDE